MINTSLIMPEISLAGYHVVTNNMFDKNEQPLMTIGKTSVAFNRTTFSTLNNCDYVRILINEDLSILVIPTTSKEPESINWKKALSKHGKLQCPEFTTILHRLWKLEPDKRYRAYGQLVQADHKIMLLFTFKNPEIWIGRNKVK